MSIVTKTGDDGLTGLMYNRRVPKTDQRVEAYGCVDELNAALGMARATAEHPFIRDNLLGIQKDLVIVMGELATDAEDLEKYQQQGYSIVTELMPLKLEELVRSIERQDITYRGWATPGSTVHSAALDMARTVCRRAERRVWSLREAGQSQNQHLVIYLNRLSDLLWLFARWVETQQETSAQGPKLA